MIKKSTDMFCPITIISIKDLSVFQDVLNCLSFYVDEVLLMFLI